MAYAIFAAQPGGTEVLERRDIDPPLPGSGEVLIRHTAIGVNFIDVYFRTGAYPWPVERDLVLGSEGAGVVEAVGPDVTGVSPGDRVAYTVPNGAYASHRIVPAAMLVPLPDNVQDEQAAGAMLKGLTVHYLIHHSYAVQPGDTVLVHAAAGGVGQIAGQWLRAKGVRAIGTAGGAEKCALARDNGYDAVIDYSSGDWVEEVKALTDGKGVAAVYDGVGKDTILGSVAVLRRFGSLVSFGQASGAPDQFRISHLASGSLRLTRPTLFHHTASREWLTGAAADLFAVIAEGRVKIDTGTPSPLADVAEVHAALEGRKTTGSAILIP
ncbi:quinone oxidoreductase family protein [Marinovum sp.]|uniref:quinone oxidoreductase family protein n=1 Tax=Marinovum sp. TaxID=2024839 RepID=UPI003A93AC0B